MRNMFKIMVMNIRRNKLMLILAVLLSVLLCTLYEAGKPIADMYGVSKISVGVIDYDDTVLSENLHEYLTETLGMEIITADYDTLSDKLLNRDISVIIEIPVRFCSSVLAEKPDNLIITSLDDYENIAFIEAYLNSYMQGISVISHAADKNIDKFNSMLGEMSFEKVDVKSALVTDRESEYSAAGFNFAMAFLCMGLGMLTIFVSISIIDDKLTKTYSRMRISNIKPIEYIIGTALFGIIVCSLCSAGLYIYTFVKGADIGLPYGTAILLNFLIILFSVGFSVMSALCFESKNTVTSLTIGFTSVACIVGGVYFPIDESVGFIKNLSYFTPHYWFTNVLSQYGEINIMNNIVILCLFILLVYLVSAVVFVRKNR